jgi:hypothetical protein
MPLTGDGESPPKVTACERKANIFWGNLILRIVMLNEEKYTAQTTDDIIHRV